MARGRIGNPPAIEGGGGHPQPKTGGEHNIVPQKCDTKKAKKSASQRKTQKKPQTNAYKCKTKLLFKLNPWAPEAGGGAFHHFSFWDDAAQPPGIMKTMSGLTDHLRSKSHHARETDWEECGRWGIATASASLSLRPECEAGRWAQRAAGSRPRTCRAPRAPAPASQTGRRASPPPPPRRPRRPPRGRRSGRRGWRGQAGAAPGSGPGLGHRCGTGGCASTDLSGSRAVWS